MKGINSTGILSSVLYNIKKLVSPVLSFLLFIPSPGGKQNCLTASQGTNKEKYFIH